MKAYKFLAEGQTGAFSDFTWPPAGEWVTVDGPVLDCLRGIHAVHFDDILDWIDDELWEVELGGEIAEREGMVIAERGRLVRRIEGWNEETALAYAERCASRVAALVATELRRRGHDAQATQLKDARDVPEIRVAALAALEVVGDDAAATELVGFAGDLFSLASGDRPDTWRSPTVATVVSPWGVIANNASFVGAHAAGRVAVAAGGGDDAYAGGFAAERQTQLDWFRSLLPADQSGSGTLLT